eukprot:482618-Amphidinium_carterae.1
MPLFRAALKAEVTERLQIMVGIASPASVLFRQECIQLFLPGCSNLVRKMLLLRLPNGNWEDDQVVEYFLPPGQHCADKGAISDLVADGLVWALASHRPETWPSHRWTGFAESLEGIGILAACHSLLRPTYVRFAAAVNKPTSGPVSLNTDSAVGMEDHELTSVPFTKPTEVSIVEPSADETTPLLDSAAADKPEHMKSADEHSQDVKHALAWLGRDPLSFVMGMRLVMEPLRLLLHHQFQAASDTFEFEQRVAVAERLLSGSALDDMLGCRHWMISLAAQGSHEAKAIAKLEELFDQPELWMRFPTAALNVHFRNTMFQLLSRTGGCLEYYFVLPHKSYPVKLFRLLHEPELWSELLLDKTCMFDVWSANLIDKCRHADVSVIIHILMAHAQQLSTNIFVTETLHASIRRAVTLSSTQTWTGDFAYVSALWVCQTLRNGVASKLVRSRNFQKPMQRERRRKVAAGKPTVTRGGGAWRAFLHKRCRGQQGTPDFSALAREYAAEKCKSDQDLHRLGYLAKVARKYMGKQYGRTSFGPSTRVIQRLKVKRLRESMWLRHRTLNGVARAQALADEGQLQHGNLKEGVKLARLHMRRDAEFDKSESERKLGILRKYEDTLGAENLKKLAAIVPSISPLMPAITPVPAVSGIAFQLAHVPFKAAVDACAWSHHSKKTCLASNLEKEWLSAHQAIPHEATRAAPKSSVLKAAFHSKIDRDKLCGGEVVMYCSSTGFLEQGASDDAIVMEEVWLHVSLLLLNPYKITFQIMERIDCPAEDPLAKHLSEASKQFLTDMHALVLLDAKQCWRVSFYEMQHSGRPLLSLDPSKVCVVAMSSDFLSIVVWPPTRKRRVARKKTRSAASKRQCNDDAILKGQPSVLQDEGGHASDGADGNDDEDLDADEATNETILDGALEAADDRILESDLEDLLDRVEAQELAASMLAPSQPHAASSADAASSPAAEGVVSLEMVAPHVPVTVAPTPEVAAGPSPASIMAAASGSAREEKPIRMPPLRGIIGSADATLFVAGGKISFYSSKGSFEARCGNKSHGTCVITRTNRGRTSRGKTFPLGGRPVAWMALWLGRSCACADKEAHWSKEDNMFSHASRMERRQELLLDRHACDLMAFERVPEEGEDLESADLKGLWP